ncbi:hypothetical protein A3H80_04835 [Candidatus Roizmanbacteria bacterium RIFCSPLOWO2_02_FULL_37_19]|uniref:Aminotransferase class I/classII large domain-containing protein n=1 Tax=Candidatus Roizmanbacteria bacterium RIFCSPHIGHO2_02_FULL_37_24 TaxID=1802037 RepID=A0A1F7GVV5_9BACT|nr:MAG: hypothetical protein A2862_02145 [Candidatus Roizmanbacteria bacterium RIFCSPHIGHO2_01_FULL_38_41]OGK23200.1 MAG: hypothetical protein A3C24_00900 [Candidatus Roizmanbacteria bacterium RIFCSPHIGHO2_02_FULL_37_24]OGK32474.1 MAG: hypothetical protein A3E10_01310 [Candidatus Roizmanbacteria bacterium RIFCSPHIGHO2_12_FULL_37_23]OGK43613.1 MAG: hypothetical protein A2956_04245 [Candidatus Roizmanbacteria bacterium RIFCSPLOWO2_01_FULL_37_57]OGK54805.1 MAG: hypothetical protein A3H80_04835 [Ca
MRNHSRYSKKIPLQDEIFELHDEFISDRRKHKVNCAIGIYLDEKGMSYIHPSVKIASRQLTLSNFNYLPIQGDPDFLTLSQELVLGKSLSRIYATRLAQQGVMGGTNGLFVWGNYIKKLHKKPSIIIGMPTWENHTKIFSYLGFRIITYKHLMNNNAFHLEALTDLIVKHPNSYVLLQAGSTHNPTGINPSNQQWKELGKIIQKTKSSALFDFAYLGMGTTIAEDCFSVRHFLSLEIPMAVVLSYSKNMTLYQHRTGVLFILNKTAKKKAETENLLKYLFRVTNSNPSAYGEHIVKTILSKKDLKNKWEKDLYSAIASLHMRRKLFTDYAGQQYQYVIQGKGLFSILDLQETSVYKLKHEKGIYLLSNGRINFGGLSVQNIPIVADAIHKIGMD